MCYIYINIYINKHAQIHIKLAMTTTMLTEKSARLITTATDCYRDINVG